VSPAFNIDEAVMASSKPKAKLDFKSIFMVLDKKVWICCLMASIGMVLTMIFLTGASSTRSNLHSVWFVFGTLLGENIGRDLIYKPHYKLQ